MSIKVTVIGGGRGSQIEQSELDYLLGVENQIRTYTKLRDSLRESLLLRVVAGAKVEPGAHMAELAEQVKGNQRIQLLVVH